LRARCTTAQAFAANAVRLQLHALAYNLGNFLRTLATPEPIKDWSPSSLKEKLIKIGAKVISHGRSIAFQMAEVAIPRHLFQEILRLIAELRPQPPPAEGKHLDQASRPPSGRMEWWQQSTPHLCLAGRPGKREYLRQPGVIWGILV
jgi:hypothetical protein